MKPTIRLFLVVAHSGHGIFDVTSDLREAKRMAKAIDGYVISAPVVFDSREPE